MNESTPLLNAEIEALAKIIAQQPHALELKTDFDLIFAEERRKVKNGTNRKFKRLCPKMSG